MMKLSNVGRRACTLLPRVFITLSRCLISYFIFSLSSLAIALQQQGNLLKSIAEKHHITAELDDPFALHADPTDDKGHYDVA